jgi:hypothetical protein
MNIPWGIEHSPSLPAFLAVLLEWCAEDARNPFSTLEVRGSTPGGREIPFSFLRLLAFPVVFYTPVSEGGGE